MTPHSSRVLLRPLFLLFVLLTGASLQAAVPFPAKDWATASPEDHHIDRQSLADIGAIMQKALSNGVLISDGFLVAEWNFAGPADRRIEVQSISKSITSMLLGLALKDGKIPSLHTKVKDLYPAFDVGPHTNEITFWHLVTATSGIAAKRYRENYFDPGNMTPGIQSRYHNDHTAELAGALTYLYGEPLIDVLRRRILSHIGADADWRGDRSIRVADDREIPVMAGYAFTKWTARDLARVGWLYLNGGNWNGEQLLPAAFVAECFAPIKVPIMAFRRNSKPDELAVGTDYGLAWRARLSKNGTRVWFMSGNGGQVCVVLPEQRIVFVKINGIAKENRPFIGMEELQELLLRLKPLPVSKSS